MHRLIRKRSVPASVVVVRLPAEIDSSNAEHVRQQLCAAVTPDVRIVVADLTGTTFCDVAGVRGLARARAFAAAGQAELRLAVRPGPVRRILLMLSSGGPFLIYPSTGDAMAPGTLSPGQRRRASGNANHSRPNRRATRTVITMAVRPLATKSVTSRTATETARPTVARPAIAITLAARTSCSFSPRRNTSRW